MLNNNSYIGNHFINNNQISNNNLIRLTTQENKELSNISSENRDKIFILIKSLIIVNYFISKNNNNNEEIKNNFILELLRLNISESLSIKIRDIVLNNNTHMNFFDCSLEDINSNKEALNNLGFNQEQINIYNNTNDYMNSICKLLNNDENNIKLVTEYLIKNYFNNNSIDYNLDTTINLFGFYIKLYAFNKDLFDLFIDYSASTCLKNNDYDRSLILENLVFPDNYRNNKELFTLLVNKVIEIDQIPHYIFLLKLLNENSILMSEDVQLVDIFNKCISLLKDNKDNLNSIKSIFENLQLFKNKLGDESFNLLINKLFYNTVEKITVNSNNRNFRYISYRNFIEDILKLYPLNINNDNIIYCISYFSSLDTSYEIIDEIYAKSLIIEHRFRFNQKELFQLYSDLIGNCLVNNNSEYNSLIESLINYELNNDKELAYQILFNVVEDIKINLNNSKLFLTYNYIEPNFSQQLNLEKNFIKYIINYIAKLNYNENNFFAIKNLVQKYKFESDDIIEILESNSHNPLLCIKICNSNKDIIGIDDLKKIINLNLLTLIDKFYNEFICDVVINNLPLLNDEQQYTLVKIFVNKIIYLINQGNNHLFNNNDKKYKDILKIINIESIKNLLLTFEPNLYIYLLGILLNNFKDDFNVVSNIITTHNNNITPGQITTLYNSTSTIGVINYIRDIQGNYGLDLPIRGDIINQNMILNMHTGNAWHIHNFSNGIEVSINEIIKHLLSSTNVKNISLDEFKNEYIRNVDNVDIDKQDICIKVLNKLQKDHSYYNRFINVLPNLVAFLNSDNEFWNQNYAEKYIRWKTWFNYSLLESAEAYGNIQNDNNISCVKGIYERFFTPFRAMSSLFDLLFLNQTVVECFEHKIGIELTDIANSNFKNRINEIINKIDITEADINDIFIEELNTRFNEKLNTTKNDRLVQLNLSPVLLSVVDKELKRNVNVNNNFLNKIKKDIKSYLENIYIEDDNVYQYVENVKKNMNK